MASLVSGGYVPFSAVTIEGITSIAREDIAYAKELGYTIKLLGIIKKDIFEALGKMFKALRVIAEKIAHMYPRHFLLVLNQCIPCG